VGLGGVDVDPAGVAHVGRDEAPVAASARTPSESDASPRASSSDPQRRGISTGPTRKIPVSMAL
jgi:hypothetical protein